jgi:Phosphotransferase enzyme family
VISNGQDVDVDRDVVVVLHPSLALVLIGGNHGSGALPVPSDDPPADWPQLLDAARRLVPDGAWPLGPDRLAPGARVHVVQARSPRTASGYTWDDEPDPAWPEPIRRAVSATLDELAGRRPIHPLRAPWMRSGWWAEATTWVDAQLAGIGRQRVGDLEPREHWRISSVARVSTTAGAVWLKAIPPIFAREPAVLDVLNRHLPGWAPLILAVDETAQGSRFMMDDAGTVPGRIDPADPPRLAALLADLQVRSLDFLPQLSQAGCADRSPALLASELARISEDGIELALLDPTERIALQRHVPRLTDHLLRLAEGPLPDAVLVHGDYHPWNVTRTKSPAVADAVIIDWTDAAIGPAGVDLTTLLPRTAGEDAHARVRREYAAVWASRFDLSTRQVERAVAAAVPAAHTMQALAYDQILRATEPDARWELSGTMAQHLRALLGTLAEPPP